MLMRGFFEMPPFPEIENIIFRLFRPDDTEAIHEVFHGCKDVDKTDPYSTLESLPSLQEVLDEFGNWPPENFLVAQADGRVIGYKGITWWTESDGVTLYLHFGRTLPQYRSREFAEAFLNWSEERIRELALEHQSKAIYGANASSTEPDYTKLLLDNGYQVVFTLAQMAYQKLDTLEEMPLPEGVRVSSAKPEQAETLWLALRAAWDDELPWGVPAVEREAGIADLRASIEKTGNFWKIVWVGDKVAAQVWCSFREYEGKKVGFLDEVHTVPEFRRRGLAALAVNRTLLSFRENGAFEGRLHTDDNNRRGAKTLYEKLGFQTLKTFPRYRKDV
jgi:mycothiol synthase